MSTSSEYYRSAHPHSHYQNFPSGAHEQDYADYLRTWQDTSHASYTGPSSVPLNLAHYPEPGLGSDYARPQQPHVQQTWNASYAPPDVQVQQWNTCVNEQTFAPRLSAPYDIVEGGASVQHSAPNVARPYPHQHHQQPATATHEQPLTSPDHAFRDTDRFTALRITSESPATPADPPFAHHGHRAHSIAHTAHLAVSEPTAEQTHAALQPSNVWGPAPALAPTDHQHYVSHTDSALSSGMLTSGSISIQTDQWPTTSAAVAVNPAPPFYGHVHIQQQQQWPALPAITDLTVYEHEGAQTELSSDPYAQNIRRTGGKKKVAKVPSSYVERQEKMKVSRRKGPLQEKQREKTHTMRKTKRICVRCRFYKSGCDEGDPCQKCSKIEGHARSFREPCYREHLEDTSIIRRCNGREQQDEAEFLGYDWQPGSELWNMDILWNLPGFGRIPNAQPMRVSFRPYTPRRGSLDTATSLWSTKEGGVCAIEQPAYAVYDTATLVNSFEGYFGGLQSHIETWIYDRIQNDEIAMQTYQEVFRMRKVHRSKTLDLAMKLQCLSIVSQGYGTVYSNDIPGIQEYDYRRLGPSDYEAYDRNSRDRPLPGAITHQMDVAAVKHLRKLEKEFVKELARLIFKPKIKPWYELFLTFYVIFWNLEYINQGAKGYMKAKNGTIVEHQVNNVVSNQVKKWEFAFPVLLYHWRCTLRGYSPFKLARDNPEELRERGHIDAEGFAYITKITEIFDRRSADRFQPPLTGFSAMHHSFASEWITQLFKEAGA